MAGAGCPDCRDTGFKGRTALFEYMPVDDAIRKEINDEATAERIQRAAVKAGMVTLRQNGWRKVREGVTTIPEVLRVTLEG
jgi:general secretion pathway protein E